MNVHTEKQAQEKNCAREPFRKCCTASNCMAWRWQPLMADNPFAAAVKKCMDRDKVSHAKACAYVGDNRAEFGLATEPYLGYCGLAGGLK